MRLEGGSETGGQGQFLTRIVAPYQALWDIATSLSLQTLCGFHGKKKVGRGCREETIMGWSPIRGMVTLILSLLTVPHDIGWCWTGIVGGERRRDALGG